MQRLLANIRNGTALSSPLNLYEQTVVASGTDRLLNLFKDVEKWTPLERDGSALVEREIVLPTHDLMTSRKQLCGDLILRNVMNVLHAEVENKEAVTGVLRQSEAGWHFKFEFFLDLCDFSPDDPDAGDEGDGSSDDPDSGDESDGSSDDLDSGDERDGSTENLGGGNENQAPNV